MLRSGLISLAVMMVLFSGWLFSDDLERPDLANVIRNIQQSLQQLQSDIKDLRSSVKQLSRSAKNEAKNEKRARADQPAPNGAASTTAWQRAQEAYDRGKGFEAQKLYGQAIEAFTKAVELDPKNDSAFLHRGSCRYNLGNYADAVSDLSESLNLQPNNSQAYAMRASALADNGQVAAALADATE